MGVKRITVGDLRERVIIQQATVTRGADYNEEILAWAPVATVWAAVTERGGREPILADRPVMLVSYEVTIRNLNISHAARVVAKDETISEPTEEESVVIAAGIDVTVLSDWLLRNGMPPTHRDRLFWRNKKLSIETITPLPTAGLLVLRCLEVAA